MSGGKHLSFWLDTTPETAYPQLSGRRSFDVAVVGAGITGVTTALLLARAGLSVGVLDQSRVATGATGHTTAKISSQHGLTYGLLELMHGKERARLYGEANEAANEQIASFVAEGIDCDFRRRASYVYATESWQRRLIEREAQAAERAGLPAAFVETAPLPYEVSGAVRFDDQAEFHARRYVLGLARKLEDAGGEIFERTRATQVHAGSPCRIETGHGEIAADQVVVATLLPFLDRGLFFARANANRSYVVTAKIEGPPPDGMFLSAGTTTRSIRSQPHDGQEILMVGGEGHHVGSGKAQPERYERLIEFARRHWDVRSIEHRWSTQDYSPDDHVPFIGPLHRSTRRIFVATGFNKWGMTNGTAAAMLLTDQLAGRDNEWSPLFSSTRLRPLSEAPRLLLENSRAAFAFFADRVVERGSRPIEDLAPGEGAIVKADGHKVAGYRDPDGELHAVSTRCTHLYCQVRWNAAETSWDCPCHGSRFDVEGEVLNGPAVSPLPKRSVGDGD